MSSSTDTTMTFLSDAELAVIRAMRLSKNNGNAIFKYAMSYDNYDSLPPEREPYVHEREPYESVFEDDPRDLLTD